MRNLTNLQTDLGYLFQNIGFLEEALTHPSVSHEQSSPTSHNQRLEFLGDAVLQLVLTHALFDKFPDLEEGPLTQARAQMVNRKTLAHQGERLGLGPLLRMSRGEELSGGRQRASALADAFEAVLGAVFLDGGFESARNIIHRQFSPTFGELTILPSLENPKGELQEILQAKSPEPPHYRQLSVSGPDHDRLFECEVSHAGVVLGVGRGKSKKTAEADAAMQALQTLMKRGKSSP